MKAIAICGLDWGISKDGKLITTIKEDQQRFKNLTQGKTVVMGRKTFDSLPDSVKPLPERNNIIMTRDKRYNKPGITVCDSKEMLIKHIEFCNIPKDDVFIIGGEDIYNQFIDDCTHAYITKFSDTIIDYHQWVGATLNLFSNNKKVSNSDKFFPNLNTASNWKLMQISDIHKSINNQWYFYATYARTVTKKVTLNNNEFICGTYADS